jgi:hypothetical protein
MTESHFEPDAIRVSSYGQRLDAQLGQMRAEECAEVYREKASGTKTGRHSPRDCRKPLISLYVMTMTWPDTSFAQQKVGTAPVARGKAHGRPRLPSPGAADRGVDADLRQHDGGGIIASACVSMTEGGL